MSEGGIVLPTGCRLHVGISPNSEKRWHAWCDCGWNKYVPLGEKGNFTTRATEKEAMAQAIWHARRGVREQAKRDIADRINGGSTTYGVRAI